MLLLKGVEIPEETSVVNPDLLMEVMEKNEDVENCETEEDLNEILSDVQKNLTKMFSEFQNSIKKNDIESCSDIFIKMKYYFSIETSIKTKLYSFTEK